MTYRLVRFPSGREVGMAGLGDPAGERLAVLLHPTPGASGFDPAPGVTSRSGVHLLTFERPGYGASEPSELTVTGWVDDLAEHLRQVEATARAAGPTRYGRVGLVGWREGGIYAAALAARHPDLVAALALVAAPAPSRLSAARRPATGGATVAGANAANQGQPAGFSDRVLRMLDSATSQGDAGLAADRRALETDMPHPESDVRALVLYGTGDDDATVEDARWYAAGLPNAIVERVDGGADIIGRQWDRILAFVSE